MKQVYDISSLNRVSPIVEIEMKKISNGIYRKLYKHSIRFLNEDGSVKSTKLDKVVEGPLYRIATKDSERSTYGEMMYTFPGTKNPVRLLALALDYTNIL